MTLLYDPHSDQGADVLSCTLRNLSNRPISFSSDSPAMDFSILIRDEADELLPWTRLGKIYFGDTHGHVWGSVQTSLGPEEEASVALSLGELFVD